MLQRYKTSFKTHDTYRYQVFNYQANTTVAINESGFCPAGGEA